MLAALALLTLALAAPPDDSAAIERLVEAVRKAPMTEPPSVDDQKAAYDANLQDLRDQLATLKKQLRQPLRAKRDRAARDAFDDNRTWMRNEIATLEKALKSPPPIELATPERIAPMVELRDDRKQSIGWLNVRQIVKDLDDDRVLARAAAYREKNGEATRADLFVVLSGVPAKDRADWKEWKTPYNRRSGFIFFQPVVGAPDVELTTPETGEHRKMRHFRCLDYATVMERLQKEGLLPSHKHFGAVRLD